ncbi:unnamed protein product, partial [Rotaria sp. Silwood2]
CPRCAVVCPIPECARPPCDNPEPTFTTINGRNCAGCPVCPVDCPIPECAPPPCENSQPTFTIVNGKQCPGCPRCGPPILEQI